jgi:sulfur-oxidizing protein SoxY
MKGTTQLNYTRRRILTAGAAFATLGTLLWKPLELLAAEWNRAAFEAKALADALKNIGATNAVESKDILIKAPDIAENGAVVPIEVTSKIASTQSIAIVAEKNPFPLVASFVLPEGTEGYASTRIKLGQTSNIKVVVKAGDGKVYAASKEIKVTIGGCGG